MKPRVRITFVPFVLLCDLSPIIIIWPFSDDDHDSHSTSNVFSEFRKNNMFACEGNPVVAFVAILSVACISLALLDCNKGKNSYHRCRE